MRPRWEAFTVALLLGLVWFPVFMFLGEAVSVYVAFGFLLVYFFGCEWLLSRVYERAHGPDVAVLLTLNAGVIVLAVIVFLVEKREVFVQQGLPMLLCGLVGTVAGAVVASVVARKAGTGI